MIQLHVHTKQEIANVTDNESDTPTLDIAMDPTHLQVE